MHKEVNYLVCYWVRLFDFRWLVTVLDFALIPYHDADIYIRP
jgi:hypothetical protein